MKLGWGTHPRQRIDFLKILQACSTKNKLAVAPGSILFGHSAGRGQDWVFLGTAALWENTLSSPQQ